MVKKRNVRQHDERDCGAACLATVFSYYGLNLSLQSCKTLVKTDMQGSNIYGIVSGAKEKGLNAEAYEGSYSELLEGIANDEFCFPLIAHIVTEGNFEHFIVITKVKKNKIKVFDPGYGMKNMATDEFTALWTGHIIAFEKTREFVGGNAIKGAYAKYVQLLFR